MPPKRYGFPGQYVQGAPDPRCIIRPGTKNVFSRKPEWKKPVAEEAWYEASLPSNDKEVQTEPVATMFLAYIPKSKIDKAVQTEVEGSMPLAEDVLKLGEVKTEPEKAEPIDEDVYGLRNLAERLLLLCAESDVESSSEDDDENDDTFDDSDSSTATLLADHVPDEVPVPPFTGYQKHEDF